ncbi:MAG: phosphate acyltransferase PlsX, partial [Solirubrobacteraceae bacterium]|nr:phosphate acyltransferase PlsX [Solirubrobacteraceae bacterium]
PAEVAAGAALAAERGVRVLLFGPAGEMGPMPDGVEVVDAPVSIAKAPDPAAAARSTRDASIVRAATAVADGQADAFVAGGSTGTALAAGLFNIKRARGIHRPALALPLPIPGMPVTLLDVGANVEVRAEHLVQFAYMGSALHQVVYEIPRPRVALLSNGEEPSRGTTEVVEAHARLLEASGLDFVGNIEGHALVEGAADVVVADGFSGNVALKVLEGTSQRTLVEVQQIARRSVRARVGNFLLKPSLYDFHAEIDPEQQGGAYLLGLRRLGVMPHGRFTREGVARAILLAAQATEGDVVGRTREALEAAGALRSAPVAAPAPPAADAAASVPGSS